MKKRIVVGLTVALMVLATLAINTPGLSQLPTLPALGHLKQDAGGDIEITWNPQTNTPSFIRGSISLSKVITQQKSDESAALALVERYADLFGIRDASCELALVQSEADALGMKHVTFQQIYQRVEVYGAHMRVHLSADGQEVVAISSSFVPDIQVPDIQPHITADQVLTTARKALPNGVLLSGPELVVYPGMGETPGALAKLAWLVELRDDAVPTRNIYVIDAVDGTMLDVLDRLYQQETGSRPRSTAVAAMPISKTALVSDVGLGDFSSITADQFRGSPSMSAQDGNTHETVFTIPIGKDGVQYEGERSEMPTWGPTAFTVAPDGTFWIADTVGNRLLHYSPEGDALGTISLDGQVVGIGDVEVIGSDILVLDIAAVIPKILRLSLDEKLLASYEVPRDLGVENGLSGIAVGDQGEVLVEREDGTLVSQLVDAQGSIARTPLKGYVHRGRLYTACAPNLTATDTTRGYIVAGDRRIEVTVSHSLSGLRFLGVNPDGTFYVVVEELVSRPGIQVDQTVRHYSAAGELLGLARVPLAEQYTYVAHGLAVGPDGAVYALITRPDRVEVQRLRFSRELEPILPVAPVETSSQSREDQRVTGLSCVPRCSMMRTAWEYASNSQYLSTTNTDGECYGRDKPHYIGGAGTYPSVAYDWGGWDTVNDFNTFMNSNAYQSGDICHWDAIQQKWVCTVEDCSRGVDCSGFVSRVWQLTSKLGTCGLPEISLELPSISKLRPGDILNKCEGRKGHVFLISSIVANGVYAYESTTYENNDRVIYHFVPTDRFNGYIPRRYSSICPSSMYGVSGFIAEYYTTTTPLTDALPTFTQCADAPIAYDWVGGGPGNGVGNDNFSVRWTGWFTFAEDTYNFAVRADDGIRVWVDDTLIIDAWWDQPPTSYQSSIDLTAGEHEVKVEYYEHGGGAVAYVRWWGSTSDSDDGRVIFSNETLWGTVGPADDVDTYYFYATQGQQATIPMTKSNFTPSLDPYLILYAPDGSEIARDDDSGGDRNALINQVSLLQTGRYRIEAKSYASSSTGSYSLTLKLHQPGQTDRRTYDADNGYTLPGTLARSEGQGPTGDQDIDNAHDFAGATHDYYWNIHGRDSYDNQGTTLVSTANYGRSYQNAYWNGEQTVYGDGFSIKDIVAHEWTHAVTEHSANLEYRWQSGALNESFSDIFGAMVDRDDWLMGEDLPPHILGGREAIRDMSNPPRFGQPDHTRDWLETCADNEGVHANGGITNKAYYNIATAIGKDKAERIFYRTLTVYLQSTSSLEDARAAALQSAQDLYGSDSAEYNAVRDGFNAVGLDGVWQPEQNDCTECAASIALAAEPDGHDLLSNLRAVRDQVFTQDPGRRWTSIYYKHRLEVAWLLISDAHLRADAQAGFRAFDPVFRALLAGDQASANVSITREIVQAAERALMGVAEKGSHAVYEDIVREWERVEPYRFVGWDVAKVKQQLLAEEAPYRIRLPLVVR